MHVLMELVCIWLAKSLAHLVEQKRRHVIALHCCSYQVPFAVTACRQFFTPMRFAFHQKQKTKINHGISFYSCHRCNFACIIKLSFGLCDNISCSIDDSFSFFSAPPDDASSAETDGNNEAIERYETNAFERKKWRSFHQSWSFAKNANS